MRFGTSYCARALIETLEGRTLLSAAPVAAHHANAHLHATAHHKPAHPKPAHHKGSAALIDPIFMQINGISGEVAVPGFVGDIQLNSFQWGVGRGISSPTGGSADRESSAPSVSEIVVTKISDKASPALLKNMFDGTNIPEIDIFFANVAKNGQAGVAYQEYVLSNVIFSGFSVSSGGDRPTESLSLNFTKIQFKNITQNADGTQTIDTVGWDLATQKRV